MAIINKHEDRESWIRWAIEFLRRGLWVDDSIELHGPHQSPADCMWGKADAQWDGSEECYEVSFQTAKEIKNRYDLRGVRIEQLDSSHGERVQFPLMPMKSLTPKAKRWLRVAGAVHANLRQEAMAEKRESRLRRSQLA